MNVKGAEPEKQNIQFEETQGNRHGQTVKSKRKKTPKKAFKYDLYLDNLKEQMIKTKSMQGTVNTG